MMKWKKVAEGHHRSGEYNAYKDYHLGGWLLCKDGAGSCESYLNGPFSEYTKREHPDEVVINRYDCLREVKYVAEAHAAGKKID